MAKPKPKPKRKPVNPIVAVTAHGGARAGAGRPRFALPPEVRARLGPAPLGDPLRVVRWWSDVITILGELRLDGIIAGSKAGLIADLKGLATVQAKLMPDDIRAALDAALKDMEKRSKAGPAGPEPEENRGDRKALRGAAR